MQQRHFKAFGSVTGLGISLALTAGLSSQALATPNAFQDARAMGMGGTGVAAARPAGAGLFNPALLSAPQSEWEDDFALTLPSVNGRLADDQDVVDAIDDIQDVIDRLEVNINNQESLPQAQQDAGLLANQLEALGGQTLRADVGAGLQIARPSRSLGWGLHSNGSVRASVQAGIADNDLTQLRLLAQAETQDELESARDQLLDNGQLRNFDSDGRVIASAVWETGLSFARPFEFGERELVLGITPKWVHMRTFDFRQSVNDFDEDDFDADEFETTGDGFSFDLGASTQLGDQGQWRLAAVVRNVIPLSEKAVVPSNPTQPQRKLEIDPQGTLGIAHSSSWHTLTLDVDVNEVEGFGPVADRQFVALGGELNLLNWLNLRAGVRHNLADDTGPQGAEEETLYTAGFALSPWALRLEAAAVFNDDEIGGGLELGFSF